MIVCQCKGTTDAVVRRAVRAGASTIGEVGAMCLAGTECGGCHETIAQIILSERLSMTSSSEATRPDPGTQNALEPEPASTVAA